MPDRIPASFPSNNSIYRVFSRYNAYVFMPEHTVRFIVCFSSKSWLILSRSNEYPSLWPNSAIPRWSPHPTAIKECTFIPDRTALFYKPKLSKNPVISRFFHLIAVVWFSFTPSVLSGINRIQRRSQSKPQYIGFPNSFKTIYCGSWADLYSRD